MVGALLSLLVCWCGLSLALRAGWWLGAGGVSASARKWWGTAALLVVVAVGAGGWSRGAGYLVAGAGAFKKSGRAVLAGGCGSCCGGMQFLQVQILHRVQ